MARYAATTDVPVEKTRAEIEAVVSKYGAGEFMSGWQAGRAMVAFKMRERLLRFILPLPNPKEERFTSYKQGSSTWLRADGVAQKLWEQACRQSWRALLLAIKAKLEAVECGIATFDAEFMAHIVLPTGLTIGETWLPALPEVFAKGRALPPLLPASDGEKSHK